MIKPSIESAVILVNPRSVGYMVGGAENQLIQLGVELSNRGKKVTLIGNVDHDDSNEPFSYEQIKANWSRPNGWLKLYKALRKIKPDIFVTRVLNPLLPIYGFLCKLLDIKLIYFCAHDWEIKSRPDKRIHGWRWRLFWIGIHLTDKLFVQNKYQLEGFKRLLLWGRGKVIINRNLPLMQPVEHIEPNEGYFTWIGSYRPHKRPEWVIELAEKLPQHKFEVIVDVKHRTKVGEIFKNAAATLENFTYVPGAAREELIEIYRRSKAILITSEGEGFPNVAIEAWSQGRPVISTTNNALLDFEDGQSVSIASKLDDFIELISETDQLEWARYGEKSLELFRREYNVDKIVSQFLSCAKNN